MPKVALWRVEGERPVRVPEYGELEKNLETWIETDPSLVLEGVRWVKRQLVLPDRSRLDLLGLTREGEGVVAELKAGPTDMSTLTQALHYAMQIGSMDADELMDRLQPHQVEGGELRDFVRASPRPVRLLLVGTSRAPDLDRGIRFLEERGLDLQVRVVSFSLFKHPDGSVLMSREVEETVPSDLPQQPGSRTASIERVQDLAERYGVDGEIRLARDIAERLHLNVKAWPMAMTINSPANRRKTLFYIRPEEGGAAVEYAAESLDEAFGVDAAEVSAALGVYSRHVPKPELDGYLRRVEAFVRGLQDRAGKRGDALEEKVA